MIRNQPLLPSLYHRSSALVWSWIEVTIERVRLSKPHQSPKAAASMNRMLFVRSKGKLSRTAFKTSSSSGSSPFPSSCLGTASMRMKILVSVRFKKIHPCRLPWAPSEGDVRTQNVARIVSKSMMNLIFFRHTPSPSLEITQSLYCYFFK